MNMSTAADCPFCRKIAAQAWPPGEMVWQFPHSIAILGTWQFFTGYCLLVSREHATELSQLGPNRTAFLEEMAVLAEAIEAEFQPLKMNYELLGNLVPHLHWHLVPRSAADPGRLQPVWLALDRAESDPAERTRLQTGSIDRVEVVARLRSRLQRMGCGEP